MDEDNGNRSVGFKQTNRNTTCKERYLALTTYEIKDIRHMIGEITYRRRKMRVLLSLFQSTISTAYASLSQRLDLEEARDIAHNWLLLLCLSLLRSQFNELEIRQIKSAYFDRFALFVDDFSPTLLENKKNRTLDDMTEDFCKTYTRFTKRELRKVYLHLHIQDNFFVKDRHTFHGE